VTIQILLWHYAEQLRFPQGMLMPKVAGSRFPEELKDMFGLKYMLAENGILQTVPAIKIVWGM
jgi:hypothetical protein